MISQEDIAWYALTFYSRLSHGQVHEILETWSKDFDGEVVNLLSAETDVLQALDISDLELEGIERAQNRLEDAEKALKPLNLSGLSVVRSDSEAYPPQLKEALGRGCPPLLFCAGKVEIFKEPCVSIIGSRKTVPRTMAFTREAAAAFGRDNVTVVSGYAEGVDRCASHAALEAGGKTILFLAQGLLTFGHAGGSLSAGIDSGKVLVASAFRPRADWQTPLAMARNAMITGMSRDVVVGQVASSGGAWEASRMALNQGKRVWVRSDESPESGHEELAALGAHVLKYPSESLPIWRRELTESAYEGFTAQSTVPESDSPLREAEVVRILREGSPADIHDASGITGHLLLKIVEGRDAISLERVDDLAQIKGLGTKAIRQICEAFGYDPAREFAARHAEEKERQKAESMKRIASKESSQQGPAGDETKPRKRPVSLDLFPDLDEFSSWNDSKK
ncbi:MAG: DNA-processing protein DprA [Candidatus Sumerlaeota bacterium]